MGDLNAVITQEEHRGGAHYYYRRKASVFSKFIATNNLLDVNFVGSPYTWCNNQQGLARRWARLDRCLVNPVWSNCFYAYLVTHLPRFLSDHSPLLLSVSPRNFSKKKLFHFENFCLRISPLTLTLCMQSLTLSPVLGTGFWIGRLKVYTLLILT